jgi:predicted amidohydrolase
MKVAAAQISCALGNLEANLAKIRDFCARAQKNGADLIVFPEMVDTGYAMDIIRAQASQWNEGAVPALRDIAKNLGLAIVAGVSEREGSSIFNSQVFIDANGEIVARYRKTHLFSLPPIEEDKCFTAGNEFVSASYLGFRLGLSICYDLRFPEVYRTLAIKNGVNVLVISSAWPFPRVEHLRVLARARAIENQSYVILANRVGTDNGGTFCGSSAMIDPYGAIIAEASTDREELIEAEVSQNVIATVRERMRVFAHRRPELYG